MPTHSSRDTEKREKPVVYTDFYQLGEWMNMGN